MKDIEVIIAKVADFRRKFGLKQDQYALHLNLLEEELGELQSAKTKADKADALADICFVTAGGIIDGFDFRHDLEWAINRAKLMGINIVKAVDAVYTSNMTKLAHPSTFAATRDKYAAMGVAVRFDPVDELDETAGYRVMCDQDCDFAPKNKLLKSSEYQEPDWSYLP